MFFFKFSTLYNIGKKKNGDLSFVKITTKLINKNGKIGIVGMYENNTDRKFICIPEHPCQK